MEHRLSREGFHVIMQEKTSGKGGANMASLMDQMRKMVGLRPQQEQVTPREGAGAFHARREAYLACEDEAQKAALLTQMIRALPDTLFLAAMCYEGEDSTASVQDDKLHATTGARRLYAAQQQIVERGNPGYRHAATADKRRIHLRTLVYQKTKEEWVPLFTDFAELMPVFGRQSRVTLISFEEAREMAGPCSGLVINPASRPILLSNDALDGAL